MGCKLAQPFKLKTSILYDPAILSLGVNDTHTQMYLYKNVHSSIVTNSHKLEGM